MRGHTTGSWEAKTHWIKKAFYHSGLQRLFLNPRPVVQCIKCVCQIKFRGGASCFFFVCFFHILLSVVKNAGPDMRGETLVMLSCM